MSDKYKDTALIENGTSADKSHTKVLDPAADKGEKHDVTRSVGRSSFTMNEAASNNKKSIQAISNFCDYLKQVTVLVWMERVILVSICIAVALGVSVPIIIYAVDKDRGSDNSSLSIDLDVDNCPTFDVQVCLNIYS